MKKLILTAIVAGTMVCGSMFATGKTLSTVSTAFAAETADEAPGMRGAMADRFFERMTRVLDLTETQQNEVQAIRERNKPAIQAASEKLRKGRAELRQVIQTHPFDEAAVRNLAEKQSEPRVELTVAFARMANEIHAILTPEQRELAEKLMPKRF